MRKHTFQDLSADASVGPNFQCAVSHHIWIKHITNNCFQKKIFLLLLSLPNSHQKCHQKAKVSQEEQTDQQAINFYLKKKVTYNTNPHNVIGIICFYIFFSLLLQIPDLQCYLKSKKKRQQLKFPVLIITMYSLSIPMGK